MNWLSDLVNFGLFSFTVNNWLNFFYFLSSNSLVDDWSRFSTLNCSLLELFLDWLLEVLGLKVLRLEVLRLKVLRLKVVRE